MSNWTDAFDIEMQIIKDQVHLHVSARSVGDGRRYFKPAEARTYFKEHMNLIMLGLFSLNIQGVEGSNIQMISHGIVSSALFLCVGVIYDRHHTRIVKYYGGLVNTMPVFIVFFLIFMFANAALPGTCNFI